MATEENMIPIEPYLKDFKQYLDANSRCSKIRRWEKLLH